MLDTPNSLNYHDFRQRYLQTIGWHVSASGKKTLVKLSKIDENKTYFVDVDGLEYQAKINSGVVFEFIPIKRGWFMGEDSTLYYMQRVPARQWQRGIHSNNTAIWSISDGGRWQKQLCDLKTISSIFSSTVPHMFVKDNNCALSLHFAIVGKEVYVFDRSIGRYKDGRITLQVPMFKQELFDVINRNQYPITIEE